VDLDDRMSLVTPEGVVVDYSLADAGSRLGAGLIDLFVQLLAVLLLAIPIAFGNVGLAISVISWFVVIVGYPTAFEVWGDGKTLGKRALGLQVRMANGSAVGFLPSFIRNLLRLIDAFPLLPLIGLVFILATKKHQRLGDFAASTVVVRLLKKNATAVTGPGFVGWDPSRPLVAIMPQELALLDVSMISAADVMTIQSFLTRRWTLDPQTRYQLGMQFFTAVKPRATGLPTGVPPERALELIVAAKNS
jgi:uncharacterized RDD family membrane protein YckC